MSTSILMASGSDLVSRVASLIETSGHGAERSLVIFPNERPLMFLARELARRAGRALQAPGMYTIDDWVAEQAEALGCGQRLITAADGAALIYQLHADRRLPGGADSPLLMEEFLAWGFKLFSDFEQLHIEGVTATALQGVQALAQEPLPEAFGRQLEHLSEWYQGFYRELTRQNLSTRSSRYVSVADRVAELDLSRYRQVILAGFFMLSGAEQKIVKALLARPGTVLVLRSGPGIERTLQRLQLAPPVEESIRQAPVISYLRANDSHGQVMAANNVIKPGHDLSDTVLVLPRPETVFPVIHHTLSRLGPGWNISMGYPLSRTPLWGLLQALASACEGSEGGKYFLGDYLRLMLHPYVKNIAIGGASYPTRILLHGIEEALNELARRLVSLDEIENDVVIRERVERKLAGLVEQGTSVQEMYAHLRHIHDAMLRPFEQITSVADFAEKLLALVSLVSTDSRANAHPYAARFFQQMLSALAQLRSSLLAQEQFEETRTYFGLLERFVGQLTVTFPGTPLAGLQVLGFWETRDLVFSTVVLLDANEGVLPGGGAVDTVLPQALRQSLGLPTARDRELIDQYHFENLLAGADQVVLCYSQGGGAQRSRFVETLVWDQERTQQSLGAAVQQPVHFAAAFTQRPPSPIAKTGAMMEAVSRLTYSATMLDTYLRCNLRFFHQYLARIQEKDEVSAGVEASEIGTLAHDILSAFFVTKKGARFTVDRSDEKTMARIVDQIFAAKYGADQDGGVYLIKAQVRARMAQVLAYHREQPGFTVLACEEKYAVTVDLPGAGRVPLFGKLDRVDSRDGRIVIVDYKTMGWKYPSYKSFVGQGREQWPRWLRSVQLPFYIMLYSARHGGVPAGSIDSELLLLGEMEIARKPLFPQGADRAPMFEAYRQAVITLIREIKDAAVPFADTWDPAEECGNCAYKVLCGRQWVEGR
ncbi:MAG TPA: PD-(D/E)XK nuclease family protein [Candidatus Edwardsbacteria bacterium]|nr:PD-(D/E)XK nuclease family protein [Candidatus Edwardsbacteria bacterium]